MLLRTICVSKTLTAEDKFFLHIFMNCIEQAILLYGNLSSPNYVADLFSETQAATFLTKPLMNEIVASRRERMFHFCRNLHALIKLGCFKKLH